MPPAPPAPPAAPTGWGAAPAPVAEKPKRVVKPRSPKPVRASNELVIGGDSDEEEEEDVAPPSAAAAPPPPPQSGRTKCFASEDLVAEDF